MAKIVLFLVLIFATQKKGINMANERMSSTSVQLSDKQFCVLGKVKIKINAQSNAEVLRKAFDFYVEKLHSELVE